jgi:hypothetical protein
MYLMVKLLIFVPLRTTIGLTIDFFITQIHIHKLPTMRKAILLMSLLTIGCITLASAKKKKKHKENLKYNNFAEWGVKAGGNMQQITAYPFKAGYTPGAVVGAYVSRHGNIWGVRAEATASTTNFKSEMPAIKRYVLDTKHYADSLSVADFDLMYVNVPLVCEVKPSEHLTMLLGVQYSALINVTDKNKAFTQVGDAKKVFAPSNVSALFGFEGNVYRNKLKIGATYNMGFSDINNKGYGGSRDSWSSSSAQIYLTYRVGKFHQR